MISFPRHLPKGLSLIELLVSLLIAGIVFGGVVAVVQTSRNNYSSDQESSFIQENARFAVELLTRDIRMAGAMGCAQSEYAKVANVLGDASQSYPLQGLLDNQQALGIVGFDHSSRATSCGASTDNVGPDAYLRAVCSVESLAGGVAASDVVVLRYADADPRLMVSVNSHSGDVLNTGAHNFVQGDKLMIVDAECRNVGIFQHASASTDSISHAAGNATGLPGNCSDHLFSDSSIGCSTLGDKSTILKYRQGSIVYPYRVHAYYIGSSAVNPGMPALKRLAVNAGGARAEELAQGVEALLLSYGLDADNNGEIENGEFVSAEGIENAETWQRVKAVRYSMVLRSQSEVLSEPIQVEFNGVRFPATGSDRYLRQEVSGTVTLRNG